jgi:hypothetical protein
VVAIGPSRASAARTGESPIDRVLSELAEAVRALRAEWTAASALADRWDQEYEHWLEHRGAAAPADRIDPGTATPMPGKALLLLRHELAEQSAREHRDVVRALVAWWADAAAVTVRCALEGAEPDPARLAVADPYSWWTADDLRRLPALAGDHGPPERDERAVPFEDERPEARRRRLWGTVWQEHRMPALPTTEWLVEALTRGGVATATVEEIRAVSLAVEATLAAKIRVAELEARLWHGALPAGAEEALEAEINTIFDQAHEPEDVLHAYAHTLTASLPAVRASGGSGGPGPSADARR